MTIQAIEFDTADEAIQWTNAKAREDKAVRMDGKYYALQQSEAHRLEAAGVEFAYLGICNMSDGTERLVTVPIN